MKIENIDVKLLKKYEKNSKIHNKTQIDYIKKSIKKYGYTEPIIIDENNMILAGHGRYTAMVELGKTTIPCIRKTDLTEKQKREYIIVDNKTSIETGFDLGILNEELEDLVDLKDFDLEFDFDLELDNEEDEFDNLDNSIDTQFKVENILNLGIAKFDGVGKYDIPEILPITKIGKIEQWIPFNYVLSDKNPKGKAVHFFIDDYQFERIWNNIDKYVDKLKQYVCVTSPDFSPYCDMPFATQIFNHYRKHWVARYLQEQGVTVIPTIRASTDERSLEWYLDGEPKESIVCISNMWTKVQEQKDYFLNKEFKQMVDKLHPSKIFVYGKEMPELKDFNIEYINTNATEMLKRMKN